MRSLMAIWFSVTVAFGTSPSAESSGLRWLARRLGFTSRLEKFSAGPSLRCVDHKGEGALRTGVGCTADAEGEEGGG